MSTKPIAQRQNTKLEAEGAEFLVLGNVLLEGIFCFKAYTNFAGYDLVAVNPVTAKSARIQVKSRWATDYDGSFPIKNFDCEFVVHVALNRGFRFSKKGRPDGSKPPEFFVLPIDVIKAARIPSSKWGKTTIRKIPNLDLYRNNWKLIAAALEIHSN